MRPRTSLARVMRCCVKPVPVPIINRIGKYLHFDRLLLLLLLLLRSFTLLLAQVLVRATASGRRDSGRTRAQEGFDQHSSRWCNGRASRRPRRAAVRNSESKLQTQSCQSSSIAASTNSHEAKSAIDASQQTQDLNTNTKSNKSNNNKSEFKQIHLSQLPDLSHYAPDHNDDVCCVCGHFGELLFCQHCVTSVHFYCAYIAAAGGTTKRDRAPGGYAHNIQSIDDLPDDEDWTCSHIRRQHCLRAVPRKFEDDIPATDRRFAWTDKNAMLDRATRRRYHTSFFRNGEQYEIGCAVLTRAVKSDLQQLPGGVSIMKTEAEADADEERTDFIGENIDMYSAEVDDGQGKIVTKNYVTLRWYFQPEQTMYGRQKSHAAQELFTTAHCDEQAIDAIECRVSVLSHSEYKLRQLHHALDEWCYFTRLRYDDDKGEFRAMLQDENAADDSLLLQLDDVQMSDESSARVLQQRQTASRAAQLHESERILFPPSLPSLASALTAAAQGNELQLEQQSIASMQGGTVFSRASALLQLSALPARLPCRETERQRLHEFVSAAVAPRGQGGALYMCGSPGLGKSCLVRQVIRELKIQSLQPQPQASEDNNTATIAPFQYIEINAMKLPDPQDLYCELLSVLTGKRCSQANRALELLDARFQQSANKASRTKSSVAPPPMIVLLVDEIDYILNRCQSVIYNLFDWPSRPNSRLTVLGISNTLDLPAMLLPRVQSRLGLASVKFMPYDKTQLACIVRERLSRANLCLTQQQQQQQQSKGKNNKAKSIAAPQDASSLPDSSTPLLTNDAIELCARKISSVSGDVRRALQICRRAVELGEQHCARKIAAQQKQQQQSTSNSNNSQSAALIVPSVTVAHVEAAICDLLDSNQLVHLRAVFVCLPLCHLRRFDWR